MYLQGENLMRKIFFTVLFILIPVLVFAQDRRAYEQEVTVEFLSEADAEKAEMSALEMPVGKKIAVGSRWDDTNGEHLLMAKTLAANGWKGTFLLNRLNADYVKKVVKVITETGSSIGAHTIHHPHLETVPVNEMFYEILANRIDIETQTDLCVTIFTFPFGLRSPENAKSTAADQAQALIRSGIYGGPEYLGMDKRLGVKPEEFLCPYLFNANDKDPDAEQFARGFRKGMLLAEKGQISAGPSVVLGVHSWQRNVHEDGFDRLGKILATESNKSEYWYCNSNEYTAWRLAFLNNKITKKSVNGKTAVFTVSRLLPADLGAELEMGLKVSPAPKLIFSDKKTFRTEYNGEFMLSNSDAYRLPEIIGRTDNGTNGDEKSNDLVSPKIPGVQLGVRLDQKNNALLCYVENKSENELTDLYFTFRLPLKWKLGLQNKSITDLPSGKSVSFEIPLGEMETGTKYQQKDLLIAGQCDFRSAGKTLRLYGTATVKQ